MESPVLSTDVPGGLDLKPICPDKSNKYVENQASKPRLRPKPTSANEEQECIVTDVSKNARSRVGP